jgi:mono/diheme cytochrome c family protein
MIRRFAVLMLLLVAAACAHVQETSAPVGEGRRVFQDQGCYGCHTVGKTGTPIGPDLSHIGAKHSRSYLIGWLRDPSSQKPTAHMPRLTLTDAEVQALAAYLGSLR